MKLILKLKESQNGSAILIVLALIAMLTAVAVMSVNRSTTDIELSYNQLHEDQAFYLAEAGSERAIIKLNEDNDWRAGFDKVALAAGYYSITLDDSTTRPILDDTVLVNSAATAQGTNANMESWIVPIYIYPFRYGMFAGQGINFDKFSCVDSYNSDSGTYAATQLNNDGDIGTNGDITTSQSVTIGGDAYTATGGQIILGPGSQVLGDTSTAQDSVNIDIIPQSEYDWAKSVSNAPGGLSGIGYTYNAGTKTLTTGQSGSIILQSGVYFFSSIALAKDSKIILAPGADVTIYTTGDINLGQFSTVNELGNPNSLQIFSQNGSLNFNQNNSFYGTFYGPNGIVQFDQTSQVYGSIVSKSIQLDQGACFHYDRNLSKVKHGKTGEMKVVAWRQK